MLQYRLHWGMGLATHAMGWDEADQTRCPPPHIPATPLLRLPVLVWLLSLLLLGCHYLALMG